MNNWIRLGCASARGRMIGFTLVALLGLPGVMSAQATAAPSPSAQAAPQAADRALPAATASGQTVVPPRDPASAKLPQFAVASIKPNKSGSNGVRLMFTPDGFKGDNVPLKFLIRTGFNVNDDQIESEPDWTAGSHFDIDARVDSGDVAELKNLSFEQRGEMIRQLLADRFGLKFHQETRDLPVYALVVAKGGPKIRQATAGDTYPNGFKGPDGKGATGMMMMNADGELTAQGVGMSNLVRILSQQTGRSVVDKTGLTGKYDFTLKMPAMHGPTPMPHPKDGAASGADDAAPDDSGEASIFTDVEEQLGLKLESQKAPLPVYVIDHIEQPSDN
ncbi:MAG: TIGR03435 family protein [Acidobacteriaceae bacterium]